MEGFAGKCGFPSAFLCHGVASQCVDRSVLRFRRPTLAQDAKRREPQGAAGQS